ncbi:MAG: UDP-glucose 4-epimerase GalE [Dehalococcoidia bacterium]|nr:UDP-glucose 4-epimerase GalE [Dehalococcoidia bacterium]
MNILVTGGAGYIGSVIVEELINAGHRVIVLDNLANGHRAAVAPEAVLVVADLGDRAGLTPLLRKHAVEAVVHMAASSLVPESMQRPGQYYRNNVINSLNLVEAMLEADVHLLVFSSTAGVYGEPERTPLAETLPLAPVNVYGETKAAFEQALGWFARGRGLRSISLRYFNAAGASAQLGEHHDPESHLIPLVLQVPLGHRPAVQLFGTDYPTTDGTAIRDYIHVVDLAQAHVQALQVLGEGRSAATAYNVGTGTGASVRDVLAAARSVTGHPIPVVEQPARPGDPAVLVADSSRLMADLGWRPRYATLEEIVATAWEWHRRHPQGYPK